MQANNILSYYTEIKELLDGRMCYPRFADLHTSNKCNHNCSGCAYKKTLNNKIIDEAKHRKIIDEFIQIGVKAFDFAGGGEPLMIPYINNLFNLIYETDCHYGIITNGSLLTDDLISQIIEQATYIRISLEATYPTAFAKYKQVKTKEWDKILYNISKLVKEKKRKKSNCEIGLKFSVGKSLRGSKHYVHGIMLGEQLNVDNIQFKILRHNPEELSLNEKKIEDKICSLIFKKVNIDAKLKKWIIPFEDKIPQCWLNPLHIVVDYKGDIYLCCYYYYRDKVHKIGNMFKTPLTKIWFNEEHKQKIKDINKNQCKKVDCKFFFHHKNIEESLKRGYCEFL